MAPAKNGGADKRPRKASPVIDSEVKLVIALNRLHGEIHILSKEVFIIAQSGRPNSVKDRILTRIDEEFNTIVQSMDKLNRLKIQRNYVVPRLVSDDGRQAVRNYKAAALDLNNAIIDHVRDSNNYRSPPRPDVSP